MWIFANCANIRSDALVSAIGSFLATPLLFLAIKLIDLNYINIAWVNLI